MSKKKRVKLKDIKVNPGFNCNQCHGAGLIAEWEVQMSNYKVSGIGKYHPTDGRMYFCICYAGQQKKKQYATR